MFVCTSLPGALTTVNRFIICQLFPEVFLTKKEPCLLLLEHPEFRGKSRRSVVAIIAWCSCGELLFLVVRLIGVCTKYLGTKLIGLGFDTAEHSLKVLSRALFDMALCFLFERIAARKHRESHYIQQRKEIVPLITCEAFLGKMSASWSKLILSNNHSSVTLWDLETCLIIRLLPSNDHFDHRIIYFKNVQLRLIS